MVLSSHLFRIDNRTLAVATYSTNYESHEKAHRYSNIYAAGLLGGFVYAFYYLKQNRALTDAPYSSPVYKLSDVAKHCTKEKGIWVTHQGSVYDITKFVDLHPGGKKILLAAGGSLEPFWAIYAVHNNSEVKAILKEYKIGVLSEEDLKKSTTNQSKTADLFANDPLRHPALTPASVKPFNAEPPPSLLVDSFNTPNDLFYVRNHMPVPDIDSTTFRLVIVDISGKRKELTLDDVKKFPKITVNASVQCAGNRRSEMSKIKPVKGLSWGHAAIGNADWTGARLVDILATLEFGKSSSVRHVHLEGLDAGPDGVSYAASVPANIALDPRHDVILAYEMNGEPLPRDHGAPLRAIVPGIVGARNVKWLGRIVLSEIESDSHWQQNDYKGLPPNADWDTADFSKASAIQELPIVSAICVPENGEKVPLEDGHISIKGYAWSGGGRRVARVDVSADRGKTWHVAELNQKPSDEPSHWSWTIWSVQIPVTIPENAEVELWAKAVDSSYNSQPESFDHIWNLRGVLSNAYHKIKVTVER